jgi:transposase
MPPAHVKASVKRNKNVAADAEAICAAVTRPSMRFVPVKDIDQQSVGCCMGAQPADPSADHAGQCAPRPSGGVRIDAPQRLAHVERQVAAIDDEQSPLPDLAALDSPARRNAVE